jgi:hypothetical protein
MPSLNTAWHQTLLDVLAAAPDRWLTPVEIGFGLRLPNGQLSADDKAKLDALYLGGRVAKRISPTIQAQRTCEYRALPLRRPRRAIILHVLSEYYDGGAQAEAEIAAALGYPAGSRLSGADRRHLLALLADGLIIADGAGNGSAPHYRVADSGR